MCEVQVIDLFALAEVEVAKFALRECCALCRCWHCCQRGANRGIVRQRRACVRRGGHAMAIRELQESCEELLRLGASPYRQEVEDLHEEPCAAAAPLAHEAHEFAKAIEKSIVADAQQWPARHIADASRFDDEHARLAVGKAAIPVEHVLRDEPILARPPRHHCRDPRARACRDRTELHWREPARCSGLLRCRPLRVR